MPLPQLQTYHIDEIPPDEYSTPSSFSYLLLSLSPNHHFPSCPSLLSSSLYFSLSLAYIAAIILSSDQSLDNGSMIWILLGGWYIKSPPYPYSLPNLEIRKGEEVSMTTSTLTLSDKNVKNDDIEDSEAIVGLLPLTKSIGGGGGIRPPLPSLHLSAPSILMI